MRKLGFVWAPALALILSIACGSNNSASNGGAWNCWLGKTDTGNGNECSCYQDTLKPYAGSASVGASCSQSPDTSFLCCVQAGAQCTCFYSHSDQINGASVDEGNCGSKVEKVASCPPP